MPNETPNQWIEEHVRELADNADPEALAADAAELAASDDPQALEALGSFLSRGDFLERLDPPGSYNMIMNLARVFAPLIACPSPETARLCLRLVDQPMYLEHDRKSLVLEALAAVVPMSSESSAAFERANDEGYFAFDALLLAKNSSVVALDLYRLMMTSDAVEAESRVELVHQGILPYRNRLTVLQAAAALIDSQVEPEVGRAAMESIFDYQREWFLIHGPTPPPWRTASEEVLRYVLQLGSDLIARHKAPAALIPAMERTIATVRALLAARAG